jgi:hypothetical protein
LRRIAADIGCLPFVFASGRRFAKCLRVQIFQQTVDLRIPDEITDVFDLLNSVVRELLRMPFMIFTTIVTSFRAPYTQAEEDVFYRRVGRGPVTVARLAGDRTKQTSPEQRQPSPAKSHRS